MIICSNTNDSLLKLESDKLFQIIHLLLTIMNQPPNSLFYDKEFYIDWSNIFGEEFIDSLKKKLNTYLQYVCKTCGVSNIKVREDVRNPNEYVITIKLNIDNDRYTLQFIRNIHEIVSLLSIRKVE